MDRQTEFVLRAVEERNVKFIRLWFTDVQGFLKSVAMAPAELEGAFAEGTGFDGSAIEGYARVFESDMIARPDPTTFQLLPWRTEASTARMFCDIALPDGSPAMADPRHVLKSALNKAADMGFTFYCHPEIEFFLFKKPIIPGQMPEPLDMATSCADSHTCGRRRRLRDTVMMLEQMGISVEFSHHETATASVDRRPAARAMPTPTIDGRHHDLSAWWSVRSPPSRRYPASFMPQAVHRRWPDRACTHEPVRGRPQCAMTPPTVRLSNRSRQFVAGLLAHSAEITAVTNQWVNSYKRLVGGGEAPAYVCWGRNNRSALIRVPLFKPNKPSAARIEYRAIDSACNPYLAYALMLNAGLDGITRELPLPDEAEDDVWALSERERRALGITALPRSLDEAIDAMESSELVAETLGEHVFDYFLRNKRAEFEEYRAQVTPFELRTHLPHM